MGFESPYRGAMGPGLLPPGLVAPGFLAPLGQALRAAFFLRAALVWTLALGAGACSVEFGVPAGAERGRCLEGARCEEGLHCLVAYDVCVAVSAQSDGTLRTDQGHPPDNDRGGLPQEGGAAKDRGHGPIDGAFSDEAIAPTSDATAPGRCLCTLAGGPAAWFQDGPAASAAFNSPVDLALEASGALVVADRDNHRVRRIAEGVVTTIAGIGRAGAEDGPVARASLNHPAGVAALAGGRVYIADQDNHRLRLLEGGVLQTVAGGTAGFADGGPASSKLHAPAGMVADGSGTVYVADVGNHSIRALSGDVLGTYVGGIRGFLDGAIAHAKFDYPVAVALNGAGVLFVADQANHRIRSVSAGTVTTVAGSASPGYADGPAGSALFNAPAGVAVGADGETIYVADQGNHRLREIDPKGQVSTLAGGNVAGFFDGPLAASRLNNPSALAVDRDVLYVADRDNHRVRVVSRCPCR